MVRLAKYVKPFVGMIVVSIGLLFVQANCDLALPDYLSRIVNTGIQQGGIESAVPEAMRASVMERLALFMSSEQKAQVLDDYVLIDRNAADYGALVEKYPALAKEAIYVLKAVEAAEIERLNPVLGKAWLAVTGIEQALADPAKAGALGGAAGFDLAQLPAGVDVFALLARLPEAQRAQARAALDARLASMGTSLAVQSAAAAVKAEYHALGMDPEARQNGYILRTGGIMLLLSLLSVACVIAVSYLSARTAAGLARDLRKDVFQTVENFSSAEFERFSTASLITRSTNDITQIQMVALMMFRMVFYAPIIGIGGVLRALDKGTSMGWIIALAVAVLMALVLGVFRVALPKFKIIQSLIDRLNLVTRESLAGIMVIRAFNRQEFELERFERANADLTGVMLFTNRVMVVMMPLMMLVMNGLSLMIIWVGAHQVAQANMQVGDMMAFLQYAMQIAFAFLMMSFLFIMLPRASVSAGRIAAVLETKATILDPQEPQRFLEPFAGQIEFRGVSFHYPDAEEDVLHEISFTVRPGQTTAFIGSTGSGKSTVVNLIPRFYDVTEGAILVDGVDIRQVRQHDLRARIGYIPQKGTLFSGTIASNLRYGAEDGAGREGADGAAGEAALGDAVLRSAIEIAQADGFIDARPEGLAAEIAQGGANVSGGQKQRLSIARALVKNAPIYIFDDSFSALDFKTDAALRRALKQRTGEKTVLIVTQRIATIKNADQIIVLEEGRVAGKGTHQELMEACETYREIALSQLSLEELT